MIKQNRTGAHTPADKTLTLRCMSGPNHYNRAFTPMASFVDKLASHGSRAAFVESSGLEVSYLELSRRVEELCRILGPARSLLVIEAENELEPVIAYLAGLKSRNPVMLVPAGRADQKSELLAAYRPKWFYSKTDDGWTLQPTELDNPAQGHPELALLLSTSGSTGTSKFVRLSLSNVVANARSIAEYLEIDATDCAATTLPFHYSYGLSVINSHLERGARLFLTKASVIDDDFWHDCSAQGVTSFAGVPYTFELLERAQFKTKAPKSLRYVTQAGGRLSVDRVATFNALSQELGFQFFVMYGQTEATARMAYVPPSLLASNPGVIGIPIPGGSFRLVDEQGVEITSDNTSGELLYSGPNVMMGYALSHQDLLDGSQVVELKTGDVGQRDANGLYSLVGRKKRFIKVFGLRIGLDEVEKKLAASGVRAIATGVDEELVVATLDAGSSANIRRIVSEWSKLPESTIAVQELEDYPLLASGKVDYAAIQVLAKDSREAVRTKSRLRTIRGVLQEGLGSDSVSEDKSFVDLGGDSLSYVKVSVALEELLGFVPLHWETLKVGELEALVPRKGIGKQVETSILLRAVAIVFVVCGHFDAFKTWPFTAVGFSYPGGAATLLLLIAGFNFFKFQLPHAVELGPMPILRSIGRILLPTVLFLCAVQVVSGKFAWSTILMYSNFIGPNVNFGIAPWFIQVLVQCLALLACFFAIPAFRRFVGRSPLAFSYSGLALAALTTLAGPFIWDVDELYNRTPHMLMYVFMLGCCIGSSKDVRLQGLNALLLLGCWFLPTAHFSWLTLVGALTLLATHHIAVFWPFNRIFGVLGGASLFIYLSHINFRQYAERLLSIDQPLLQVLVSLIGGVCLWLGWEWLTETVRTVVGRYRSKRSDPTRT